jgi:hypothetical protein
MDGIEVVMVIPAGLGYVKKKSVKTIKYEPSDEHSG